MINYYNVVSKGILYDFFCITSKGAEIISETNSAIQIIRINYMLSNVNKDSLCRCLVNRDFRNHHCDGS